MIPQPSKSKHDRGEAKEIKEWGTGVKLAVRFNETFHPLGKAGSRLAGQLGNMLRNGFHVPLTYLDWNYVPESTKDFIWKDVQV